MSLQISTTNQRSLALPLVQPLIMVVALGVTLFSGCADSTPFSPNAVGSASHQTGTDSEPFSWTAPKPVSGVTLKFLGRQRHGSFAKSASEIAAYDPASQQLFVVNGEHESIDFLKITNPAQPELVRQVSLKQFGSGINSVTAKSGIIAAAVSADPKQQPGSVVFLSPSGEILKTLTVGAEPDMLVISPDGKWLLTANEGEPTDDYKTDPEGSISLIDLAPGIDQLTQAHVTTLDFHHYNDRSQLDPQVRVFGPNASVSQDFEPEYITISPDSKTAWVSLQEANAFAIIDLTSKSIKTIVSLGFKDHSQPENALDVSDKDGQINIRPWPVWGMYMPDAIASLELDNELFVLSANEGDHRKFSGFQENVRVSELQLDPQVFPNADQLQQENKLGRLVVTSTLGDEKQDGVYEKLYSFGARSFSVWSAEGQLIYDSGSEFERIIADRFPKSFNADHESNKFDDRSDNKGPEPEGITLGQIDGVWYAFIGIERHSGIMIYSLKNPRQPEFVDYVVTRNFDKSAKSEAAGDLGPEGILFIPAEQAPQGKPLLVVNYEVSGTTSIFEVIPYSP